MRTQRSALFALSRTALTSITCLMACTGGNAPSPDDTTTPSETCDPAAAAATLGATDDDCDGVAANWDCDDSDPTNACQSPAVETLVGRWHCEEDGKPNLLNTRHLGGNHFEIVFDWRDGDWCRKLGTMEITTWVDEGDFSMILRHDQPAEEEDFYFQSIALDNGTFQWTHDLTTLPGWQASYPESFSVICERCGPLDGDPTCDAPVSPWPIDYDYPLADVDICDAVNFVDAATD